MRPVRQSEISSFSDCRRKWWFAYEQGIVPVSIGRRMPASSHRDSGSAAHKGVEIINKGGTLVEALDAVGVFIDEVRSIRLPEGDELPELTKEDDKAWWEVDRLARAMTTNYAEWSRLNEGDIEFLATELQWEVPLTITLSDYAEHQEEVMLFGQIDAALHDPLVGLVIRDNKSVQSFGQTPQDVDFQLRTYAWAWWNLTGDVPDRAEHLMMKRVLGLKTKGPLFERVAIPINKRILRAHEGHLRARVEGLTEVRDLKVTNEALFPNPGMDCSWKCEFKDLCSMVDDGSDVQAVVEEHFVEKDPLD